MIICIIVAMSKNRVIGKDNNMPWHLSEDLKNFKKITLNSTIIMGRKTWDSLPIKPLPKRENIILSSKKQSSGTTYHSLEECLTNLKKRKTSKVFIIGGRSIYRLFFNLADYLHISYINIKNDNINEFFPFKTLEIKRLFNKVDERKLSKNTKYTYWEKL